MPEVIPAILEKDFEEIKRKIRIVEEYVKWVQVDVSDGDFTPNITWNNPQELKSLNTKTCLEAHLMISNPVKHLDDWLNSRVKRVILHIEAFNNKSQILTALQKIRKVKKEIGIALHPGTRVKAIKGFIDKIDLVLFLGVSPGFGGQKFQPRILKEIKSLRKLHPRVKIGVDGGINLKTGKQCVKAGADILVSGTYIFKSKNIKETIKKLSSI